jgi:hypothetical protein
MSDAADYCAECQRLIRGEVAWQRIDGTFICTACFYSAAKADTPIERREYSA